MDRMSATLLGGHASKATTQPTRPDIERLQAEPLEPLATPASALETALIAYGAAAGTLCIVGAFLLC